jgi:hypothetical protein
VKKEGLRWWAGVRGQLVRCQKKDGGYGWVYGLARLAGSQP